MQKLLDEFLQNDEMRTLKIPSLKPESMKVRAWRQLKKFKERTGIDPNIRICLGDKCVLLEKEDLLSQATCILSDGREIPVKDLFPSPEIKRLCRKIKEKTEGTLPSYEDVKIPSIEEIETWDLSKPDRELLLETIKDIIKVKS